MRFPFLLLATLSPALDAQIEWTQRGDGITARSNYAMAYDSVRGVIVLFGGSPATGPLLADTWEYTGSTWTRRTPLNIPPARHGATMAFDARRQQCVMFGGFGTAPLRDTWVWNGLDWLQLATTGPDARLLAASTYDQQRDRVLLFGGTRTSSGQGLLSDTWEWDGTRWTQLTPAASPPARYGTAMAYDALRRRVVLAAGIGLSGTTYVPLDDCHEWDPTAASWIAGARLPTGIRTPALAGDPVAGGVLLLGSPGTTLPLFLRYDGLSWTPITTPTVPTTAFGFGLAFDTSRDRLVTFGGTSPLVTLDATWEWDRNDWVRVVGGPPGSAGYRMVYDAALRAPLLFTPNSLTAVSQWNGRSWTTIGNTAPGYIYPAYAFDRARGVTVRYGGLDFARLASVDETWTFDGTSWQQLAPPQRPGALLGAAMAFDELRGTVLLFGGMVAGRGLSDDTWEWNGNNWTQLQPTVRPPARILHTLTFDRRRGRMVLFGGNGRLTDIWEWDGSNWFATTPTRTPTAMQLAFMTYDDARQRCVALGLGTNFDEHWEWDGSDWLQRQPTLLPPPRNDAAIAFDETRQCVVMFGGQLSGTGRLYTDTWELRSQVEGSYRDLGAGCATPAATLTSVGAQKPWSGEALSVEVAPLTPTTLAAALAYSASNTAWSGVPLPLDLTALGATACLLRVGLDVLVPMQLGTAGASQVVLVPAQAALLGRTVFQQALLLVPGANPAGLILSSARAATIGTR